jgi:hypothetical protein
MGGIYTLGAPGPAPADRADPIGLRQQQIRPADGQKKPARLAEATGRHS